MYVSDVFDLIADALSVPRSTALMYRRALHKAGMLSTGARGRNAPHATCRDLAVAFLGMVASPRPATSPDYVRDFGALPNRSNNQQGSIYSWFGLPEDHTYIEMLTRFFEGCGSDDFAVAVLRRMSDPYFQRREFLTSVRLDVVVHDTQLHAGVGIGEQDFVYHDQDFAERGIIGREAVRAFMREKAGSYYRNLKSMKTVDEDGLEIIIEGFHGITFARRLSKVFDENATSHA